MALVKFPKEFPDLKDHTVVITGGASGIGEGYVRLARKNGANVVFGDLNGELGEAVARQTGATFVRADMSVYTDQVTLFEAAYRKHGSVDHAIANAGVYEPEGLFDHSLDLESVQKIGVYRNDLEWDEKRLGWCFKGTLNQARRHKFYLRQGASAGDNKSITVIASTAAITCPSVTPLYNTSKTGMLGLARSLAASLPTSHGIRVNAVCPSVTATPLAAQHVLPVFEALKLPINSATELAEQIAGLNCDENVNGKILYVEGGKAWDIVEGLERTKPEWLGTAVLEILEKLEQYRKTMERMS